MEIINVNPENCVGCNRCINVCPVDANKTYLNESGHSVSVVNSDVCIECGECIKACEHNARYFLDDTENFFNDLAKGEKISIIAAPAVRFNFDNWKNLLGFFKSKGVDKIYDVSFGADITTWAYLKAVKEIGKDSVIA